MARKKSEFVSAFGTSFEIFKRIADEVMAQGGSDDDLRKALADDTIVRDVARLLLGTARIEPSPPTDRVFTLDDVDWESPIQDVHRCCDLDESGRICEGNDSPKPPPPHTRYTVLDWDQLIQVEDVRAYCRHYGYDWRLSLREFLAYVAKLPRSYRGSVSSLESMYFDERSGSMRPCFSSDGIRRVLREEGDVVHKGIGILVRLR